METQSSILAWTIPWTEEPGGLHTVHGAAKKLDMPKQQKNRGMRTSDLLSFGYLSTGHGVFRPQRISCFPVNVNVISSIRST